MKKISLILSIFVLAGCKFHQPLPDVTLTVYDAKRAVCRDYKLVDAASMTFEGPVARWPEGHENCMRVFGFREDDFKKVQNWIRDEQKNQKSARVYHSEEMESQLQ